MCRLAYLRLRAVLFMAACQLVYSLVVACQLVYSFVAACHLDYSFVAMRHLAHFRFDLVLPRSINNRGNTLFRLT